MAWPSGDLYTSTRYMSGFVETEQQMLRRFRTQMGLDLMYGDSSFNLTQEFNGLLNKPAPYKDARGNIQNG